jgi:hypothetical protein
MMGVTNVALPRMYSDSGTPRFVALTMPVDSAPMVVLLTPHLP